MSSIINRLILYLTYYFNCKLKNINESYLSNIF